MTNESATLLLAVIGAVVAWTTTVATLMLWLTGKFRSVEQTIYREMDKHRREYDLQIGDLRTRVQRLELKEFGFTETP